MVSQGSVIIYQHAIQPFLAQHESRIDRALLDLQKQARRTGLEYGKRGIAILNSALGDLLVKVSQETVVGQWKHADLEGLWCIRLLAVIEPTLFVYNRPLAACYDTFGWTRISNTRSSTTNKFLFKAAFL
jgi:hypothetical protein